MAIKKLPLFCRSLYVRFLLLPAFLANKIDFELILFSSHITSDLEKIANYITFIHQGRIVLTESKDNLIYKYAILRCKEKQFESLDKNDILAYRRQDYQIDVLVDNKEAAKRKYAGVVIDCATIDEIMLILVKGEQK